MTTPIDKLHAVLTYIKDAFIGKDEIIDILGISLLAKENAFLLGPPGTAKSAIVRMLASCITDGKNFEYLLTRFTEPNEIFGPFDIRKLKEGELVTNTEGMMPEASMVFLDEIFNANSAILNSLLTALNERIFRVLKIGLTSAASPSGRTSVTRLPPKAGTRTLNLTMCSCISYPSTLTQKPLVRC